MTQLLSIYIPQWEAILRSPSRPVTQEDRDTWRVKEIIDVLLAYSEQYPMSVWFSAIQFGYPLQIFYINCRPTPNFPDISHTFQAVVINPVIETLGEELFAGYEWCMSIVDDQWVPTYRWRVSRSTSLVCNYTDQHGERHEGCALAWFTGVIFQHEYDHLQGTLIDQVGTDMITNTEYLAKKAAGEQNLYLSY